MNTKAKFLALCDAYASIKWYKFRKRANAWGKLVQYAKENKIMNVL